MCASAKPLDGDTATMGETTRDTTLRLRGLTPWACL